MSDDGPHYSRNIVQRRQLVPVLAVVSFVTTLSATWAGLDWLCGKTFGGPPWNRPPWVDPIALAVSFGTGLLAGTLGWHAGDRIHRSLWPEHPDEG